MNTFHIQYCFRLARYVSLKRIWNYAKMFFSYQLSRYGKTTRINYLPPFIALEPTNYCNLQCPECPTGMGILTRAKGKMETKNAIKVIDELRNTLIVLTAYFQGEPLLDDNFYEIVKHASSMKIFTISSTNAQFLDDKAAQKIVNSGLDKLIISIDGFDQESYGTYRVGGDFGKVIAGIRKLKQERLRQKASHPLIVAQCLVLKTTENKLKEIKTTALKAGADKVVFKSAQFYSQKNIEALFPRKLKGRYILERGKPAVKKNIPNHCKRLWSSPVVTWNGHLVPCCFDKDSQHQFGNIFNQPFTTAWQGAANARFRELLLNDRKKIKICRNCTEGM